MTQAPNNGMIATADSTNLIKIWTSQKVFVREIQFAEPIKSLRFISAAGDLVIAHKKTISIIKAAKLFEDLPKIQKMSHENLY